jgi:hypothetical protein
MPRKFLESSGQLVVKDTYVKESFLKLLQADTEMSSLNSMVKPGQTADDIKKQGYVTYIYMNQEVNVPKNILDCAECPGDIVEYIKEVCGEQRRLQGLKSYDTDDDDEYY